MNFLILDDSPSAILDIELKVQSIMPQARIHRALNYVCAEEILRKVSVDLALIDLSMPDKNGMDFISDCIIPNPVYEKIPIIVITAFEKTSILNTALSGSVSSFLKKPVSPLDLQNAIEQVFNSKAQIIG